MTLPGNLEKCEYNSQGDAETEESLQHLESLIGVRLPLDYRNFLAEYGAGSLDSWAHCTEPTPFGDNGMTSIHSISEVIELLSSSVAPRNMICIGYGDFGATTCLSIASLDHGSIFALDTEMRMFWDEDRLSQFPNLDKDVANFFKMRNNQELPSKPWGYENTYHIADSFTQFLNQIRPLDET